MMLGRDRRRIELIDNVCCEAHGGVRGWAVAYTEGV